MKQLEFHKQHDPLTVLRFGHAELPADELFLGDNLAVLSAQADESVDLIYVDPPFATGTTRRSAVGHRYDDTTPLEPYLVGLRPRWAEMRRTLTRHGSLFVHLDARATHYVKIELDRLFGPARFVNEIVWCYSVGGKGARAFGRKHDTILWYAKSRDYAFFPDAVRIPRKPGSHMRVEHDDSGRPVQVKRDKQSGRVYRYPVHEGKIPDDYWTDIETLNRGDAQRTGWPTQKPEALSSASCWRPALPVPAWPTSSAARARPPSWPRGTVGPSSRWTARARRSKSPVPVCLPQVLTWPSRAVRYPT